jgi:hypothetical protein
MTFTNAEENRPAREGACRERVSAQRREALLDEFERSALSGAQFARRAGLKYPTFAAWVQNRRGKTHATPSPSRPKAVAFIEALPDADPHSALTVELGGVARVEVRSSSQLHAVAELIGMLASARRPC